MRIVRFSPEERVDVPDMTAVSFLQLGEFRRTLRALIMEHGVLGVVRGFAVEPAAPADSTVRIVLDPGGGAAKSVAIGAENTGSVDAGQLIGDTGQEGLEGNATYVVDFTPEAPGTHKVEMRFSYQDGASDNRAFWNPGTDAEYISSTATRHLPTLEMQIVAAYTGDEWIPLATVVWDGATIEAADITDDRVLLFEGASPWTQTTQEGTGAMPDFDRDDARATVTSDTIYAALRKIGRQIQDIKGPDADGLWSFFKRVIGPMDPDGLLDPERTKSLASLDSLEYTVGDGTTTWGDFNGATGLQACLSHIAASEANLPSRIRIRLKSRQTGLAGYVNGGIGALGPIWTCTTEVAFATVKYIEIIGDSAKSDKNGRVPVAFTHNIGAYFQFALSGGVTLRNIAMHSVPAQGLFQSELAVLRMHNCMVVSQTGSWVIRTNTPGLVWEDSEIYGAVAIYTNSASGAASHPGFRITRCFFANRTVFGTAVASYVRFWGDATFSDDPADATWFAGQGKFTDCGMYYTGNPAASSTREAIIDMRGAAFISFENIEYGQAADSNLILLGAAGASVSRGLSWSSISVLITEPTNAHHDVNLGYNTTNGTGWTWFSSTDVTTPADSGEFESGVVHSCTWENVKWLGMPMIDSGCISVIGAAHSLSFKNLRCEGCTFPAITYGGTPRLTCINLRQTDTPASLAQTSGDISIDNCSFGRIGFAGTEPVIRHVKIVGGFERGVTINNSTFSVTNEDGTRNDTAYATIRAVMGIERNDGAGPVTAQLCRFHYFTPTGTDEISAININSLISSVVEVDSCKFQDSTYNVVIEGPTPAASTVIMRNNRFKMVSGANPFWVFKGDFLPANTGRTEVVHMIGNVVYGTIIAAADMVNTGLYENEALLFSGNNFTKFGVVTTTLSNPVGLGSSPPQNIDGNLPVDVDTVGREEYTFRDPITRTVFLSPLMLCGQDSLSGGGSVVWEQDQNDATDMVSTMAPSAIGKIPLTKALVPDGAEILRVRVGYKLNAAAAGTATVSLRRRTVDKTAPFAGDVYTPVWSENRSVAGDHIFDSTTLASNNDVDHDVYTFWITVTSADAGALDPDIVQWIELTYSDPGYRG